jgi:hypothetical protein
MVVLLWSTDDPRSTQVAAYDERLNVRFRTQLASSERSLALAVDLQGNSLVLLDATDRYGSGSVGGIWIDHSGNAGAEFQALEGIAPTAAILLTSRVGSGLFAGLNSWPPATAAWLRQFDPMGKGGAPPDWLVARPGTKLHIARNGAAYAVMYPPRLDVTCHADVEIVTASGRSCGTAVFPADQAGTYCVGYLSAGYDGTVVQARNIVDVPHGGGDRIFTFRWWTGFLH